MGKGVKISIAASALLVTAIIGSVVFVPPKMALSAAIMRDCIGVVKQRVRGGVDVISVAAIQPEPNKRRIEDFRSATQALIRRGALEPSEPEVLVEFEASNGSGSALCTYHADLWKESGTYSSVSKREVQIGIQSVPDIELLLMGDFRVGYVDRVLALIPILGSKQKFFLD